MPPILFYFFAALCVLGGLGVVISRNPVTSAFSMIASFLGVAALFIGMNAFFIGIIQILVYAGAIMVLFLFIIMLLDVRAESNRKINPITVGPGALIAIGFVSLASVVLMRFPEGDKAMPELSEKASQEVQHLGQAIFTEFNFPLQMVAVLLLVATIGVVVLSKRELN